MDFRDLGRRGWAARPDGPKRFVADHQPRARASRWDAAGDLFSADAQGRSVIALALGLADADDRQQALFGGRPGVGQDDLISSLRTCHSSTPPDPQPRRPCDQARQAHRCVAPGAMGSPRPRQSRSTGCRCVLYAARKATMRSVCGAEYRREDPGTARSGAPHVGGVVATQRGVIAVGAMMQSLLGARGVDRLAVPNLQRRALNGAGEGENKRPWNPRPDVLALMFIALRRAEASSSDRPPEVNCRFFTTADPISSSGSRADPRHACQCRSYAR
jgi:hypothetical protein